MGMDIIIPAYNAKDTLFFTLSSIAVQQRLDKMNIQVYLVNDCSDYDYHDFVEYFSSFFPIQELKTPKNVGPGGARNYGIDHSHQDYIVFIDSDDVFYSPYSLHLLFQTALTKKRDLIISNFIYERDQKRIVKSKNLIWLHGKVYKRSFLDQYAIRFNESRANEDNGFNRLILLLPSNIMFLDDVTYVYRENTESITRKNNRQYRLDGLEGYTYNMEWAAKEGLKRGCSKESIFILAINVLICMYYYYMELYEDFDVSPILKWSKPLYSIYLEDSQKTIRDELLQAFLARKEKEYRDNGTKFHRVCSFKEFLRKVDEIHD